MMARAVRSEVTDRAAALRDEFDQAFAQPEKPPSGRLESVLALRFDTAPYAVPLSEVAELARAATILSTPSEVPAFLGLMVLRGSLLPAYDLAAMLAHSPAKSRTWMLLIRAPHPVAFVFDDFEGHRHIAEAEHAGEAVRDGDLWRPLIRLSSLTKTLQE